MALDDTWNSWTQPSSASEQEKQECTERMIQDAISSHEPFSDCGLVVFAKGSYPNNTNVRLDSDVDIALECTEVEHWEEAEEDAHIPGEPYEGIWTPAKLRSELTAALMSKFPGQVDLTGSIALQVHSSTARIDADVVPCFSYRYYFGSGECREGTKIFSTTGRQIVNYPRRQLKNGRAKNVRTGHNFKKAVRILKRIANAMVANGEHAEVPSYFIECLAYNCPDDMFDGSNWTDAISAVRGGNPVIHDTVSCPGRDRSQRASLRAPLVGSEQRSTRQGSGSLLGEQHLITGEQALPD